MTQWGNQPQLPGQHQPYTPAQTETTAVVSLVLACAAFVVCPLVLAIVALVLAGQADEKIAASGGRLTGESLTKAARIIAWINIAIGAVMLIVMIGFAAGGS